MNENLAMASGDQMLLRIRGEYLEMPGLRLTLAQARRLWDLDERTCAQLLQSLTDQRFLCHRDDGTYVRMVSDCERLPAARTVKARGAPASPATRVN